jgi:hypothetical protein
MAYSFSTAHASSTGAVAITHNTRLPTLPEIGMINPLGNVHIIPAPIVAGQVTLLEKLVGTVGPTPHATQAVVNPAGSPTSSGKNAWGDVGVPPIAPGLPSP